MTDTDDPQPTTYIWFCEGCGASGFTHKRDRPWTAHAEASPDCDAHTENNIIPVRLAPRVGDDPVSWKLIGIQASIAGAVTLTGLLPNDCGDVPPRLWRRLADHLPKDLAIMAPAIRQIAHLTERMQRVVHGQDDGQV